MKLEFLDISILDFFFQILGFASFLRFFNINYLSRYGELIGLIFPFFLPDERLVLENFFSNAINESYIFWEAKITGSSITFPSLFNDSFALFYDENFQNMLIGVPYLETLSFNYSLNLYSFEIIFFFFSIFFSFFFLNSDDENLAPVQEDVISFLSLAGSGLTSGDELFTLFFGFELLTITLVLTAALDYKRHGYNRFITVYYLISVVVSLVIFYFLFFFIFMLLGSKFFTFFDLFSAFSESSVFHLFLDEEELFYTTAIKFFFLQVLLLFMFKFTLGPMAFWVLHLYPTFPLILLFMQMVFLKYDLFFLFFDFFDFLFFFDKEVLEFLLPVLSFIIFISMFVGCLAYKINNLKLLLTITSFSQIGYVCISYLSPSFILIVYSINYLTVYLLSLFLLLVILLLVNLFYNVQYFHELVVLKFFDFSLFILVVVLLCSLAGLPPFMGFFLKFALLVKILVTPYFFSFGLILLITSFVTLFIYINVVYALFKVSSYENIVIFSDKKNLVEIRYYSPFKTVLNFLFTGINYTISFFLISPTFQFFQFSNFAVLNLWSWNLNIKILDLLNYYFEN